MNTGGYPHLEGIMHNCPELAYIIIRASLPVKAPTFLIPPEFKQVEFIVHPAGGQIRRHAHRKLPLQFNGTSGVVVIKKVRCLPLASSTKAISCSWRPLNQQEEILIGLKQITGEEE